MIRTATIVFALAAFATCECGAVRAQQLENRATAATSGTVGTPAEQARKSGANVSSGGHVASESTEDSLPKPDDDGGTPIQGRPEATKDLYQH